ncbi:MAG: hypothetical protein MRERV_93c003 [Mycoplasmataceae bacterium RV_VA103A]|nr:MAG: hypothetical protein MRERV_93c003 [Mycoplasmataceae bacterium RV_VA103A]
MTVAKIMTPEITKLKNQLNNPNLTLEKKIKSWIKVLEWSP